MRHFIGIDIGGTSIKYGLVNEDLTVEKDGSCKTPDAGQRILETICCLLYTSDAADEL